MDLLGIRHRHYPVQQRRWRVAEKSVEMIKNPLGGDREWSVQRLNARERNGRNSLGK